MNSAFIQNPHNDWSISNWGSKWNGYDFAPYNEGDNSIEFNTAWSTIPQVVSALSEKYPEVIIKAQWADEDLSYNVGEREYKNGEIISENIPIGGSKEAYEMAADIQGYDLEDLDYRLKADGSTYEYVEVISDVVPLSLFE